MDRKEIENIVNQMMIEKFEVDPLALKPDAKLKEDLKLDSLDYVDMLISLEKKTGGKLPQINFSKIITLHDVYKLTEIILQGKN